MKLYCHIEKIINTQGIENFVIKEGPCELPPNSRTISNLNLLDDEMLKLFGWVPVVQCSENKPVFVSVSYQIFEDKVIETLITRNYTEEEIAQEKEKHNHYVWQNLRQQRNELLKQSDALVTIDRWEKLSPEEKQKLTIYRQSLRDLPSQNFNPALIVFPSL